jgi:hypothetical protein
MNDRRFAVTAKAVSAAAADAVAANERYAVACGAKL